MIFGGFSPIHSHLEFARIYLGAGYFSLTHMNYLHYLANVNLAYRCLRQFDSSSPTTKADKFGFDDVGTICHG